MRMRRVWANAVAVRKGTEYSNNGPAWGPHGCQELVLRALSANPALSGSAVRQLLGNTTKKLTGQTGWTAELGWRRLDVRS
jgi:hypothetical protein